MASLVNSRQSSSLRRSVDCLHSSVSYTRQSDQSYWLRPRRSSEVLVHPVLVRHIFNQVTNNDIELKPFFLRAFVPPFLALGFTSVPDHSFVDIEPFLIALQFVGAPGVCSSLLTTKLFHRWCSPPPLG